MGTYIEVIKKSFQQEYIYRANTYISIIRNAVYLFISVSIWTSLFASRGVVDGVGLKDMVAFLVINLLLRNITRSRSSYIIGDKINSGEIITDLLKPISFNFYMFASQIGKNLYSTAFSTLPVCILAMIFYDFTLPDNLNNIILFIITAILGVILMYYIDYVSGLLSFWLKNGLYMDFFTGALFEIFSGATIPLWFYPGGLRSISNVLPFRLITFEPVSIYLGKVTALESLNIICAQLVWVMIFILLERFIWSKATKVVTIHGG
jgi:ABC-type uncharacterized transport system, permease component